MVIRVACFEDIVWMELSQDRVRIWKLFAVVKFVIRLLTFFLYQHCMRLEMLR